MKLLLKFLPLVFVTISATSCCCGDYIYSTGSHRRCSERYVSAPRAYYENDSYDRNRSERPYESSYDMPMNGNE